MKANRFFIVAICLMLCFISTVPVMAAEKGQVEMKIGIIGAMESEVDFLKETMHVTHRETKAGMEFCEGNFGTMKAVVVQSGMGKVHAAICAQILVDDFAVTHIINTGVAGSLNEKLDIGAILVSVDAVQHDFTVEAIGFKKGEIPYTGQVAFAADEELRQKAVEAVRTVLPQVSAVEGRVCSGDQFISSQEAKDRIVSEFDGDCAEMEGAAIAQVCYANKIPFVILRAISDKADDSSSVSFEKFEKQAAKNSATLVQFMLEHWVTSKRL
jgi:adenosylhomocysteine nucleosidase